MIRHKMIKTSRIRTYLLYALGEIFLIVIGIFVAVQLNNLNQGSQNKKLETNYLHGILENLDQDINSLISHARVQTYKLDVLTILVKAFSDEYIRADRHLLKHALSEAYGIYDFDPQRNIFDGMKSAGNTHVIESPEILNNIQKYYVQSEAVVKTEALYNEQIIGHQRHIFIHMININSISESHFKLQQQAKLVDDDLSFFDKEINNEDVKEFANRVTDIKLFTQIIINRENQLRNQAEELKKIINEYLGALESENSSEQITEFGSPTFIPSIPKNSKPIKDEELSEFIGTYQLVQSNNQSGPFTEKDRIIITIERNHLVLTNRASGTSHSFYYVEEDEFKRATSFLFDDPKSFGRIKINRNEDHNIIALTLSEYVGFVHKYARVEDK